MPSTIIRSVRAIDARYVLKPGEGTDAIHNTEMYGYAAALLETDPVAAGGSGLSGTGLAFTMGGGNELITPAIEHLGQQLVGHEIEELMAGFGGVFKMLADDPQYRWVGPHKGVIHLALAAVVNACWDLWAKARGVPLWKLIVDLSPEALLATMDLSYLEDVLTAEEALALLRAEQPGRAERVGVVERGYPGYDTSVGWFNFSDAEVRERAKVALGEGFGALKLKVGGPDGDRDVRRFTMLRELVGPDVRLMVDANQQWSLPRALEIGERLRPLDPFWIEEPTHPDDIEAHRVLARALAPIHIAAGEMVPHRVLFKNLLQADALGIIQVDVTRVGGVSEFLAVALLARRFGKPVVPHVGDMGQIHQHLVLADRIALGLPELFLEYIPHLRPYFVDPAVVRDGRYVTPQRPGSSSDLAATSVG
ncbi:MAG: enolase C-terminal domain-like protein [Chloroflexota bacterium]